MTNPVTGPEAANWQKNFLQRFRPAKHRWYAPDGERTPLHQAQQGNDPEAGFYFAAVDAAFEALNVEQPERRTRGNNDDRSIEKGLKGCPHPEVSGEGTND